MKKRTIAALMAFAPFAFVASMPTTTVAQVTTPLPPGAIPLPGAPTGPGDAAPPGKVTVLPRGDTVRTRARPEYDPLGIRLGAFLLYPQLAVDQFYNDNIFAENDDEVDDFITVVRPEMTLESNWARHAFAVAGGADVGFFAQNSDQDFQDGFAATDGRIDVSRDIAVYLGGGAARRHELRGSPDDVGGADSEPTIYYNYNAFARYDQDFDRVGLTVDALFDRLDYEDTQINGAENVSNNDRDRNVYSTPVRLGFEFSPDYEGFVRVAPNIRRYDQTPDAAGEDRDSWGYQAVAGLAVDFGVTFGEIYAGYMQQFYDDLNDASSPTFGGALTWNATTLTTVVLAAERSIIETTATGASSYISTSGELTIDHELLRNVILTAGGAITYNDYEGISREDTFYLGNAGVRYLLNRNLYLSAGYLYRHRDSDTVNNFTQNVFRIGLQTQL